ncbi:methyltransferase domain-containing protein [Rhodospira trueperi]|uniref:Methyltransferase domain-containing protein n=1 Tax=Rhodospira trueperi TaxID=69960 RepID=A0A1G7GPV1_9PROT|nr:methyltransferase domain-containing protein [Rhodospira trueperi]SDE90157.1 Methyltransferase domain-containing protein [Rhodospira trueperi]
MLKNALDILRCPVDFERLVLDRGEPEADGHILEGDLRCESCGAGYPIRKGVPHLVPEDAAIVDGADMGALQERTIERFGWEWQTYEQWGWLPDYPDVAEAQEKFYGGLIEHTHAAFWGKSLFEKEDLRPGDLVLDAGCGNGRFSKCASEMGATVVGVDLGWGVYSAFNNLRHKKNVHIARGDIFRLPVSDGTFDRVFSIGVLMHTGNAKLATQKISMKAKTNGLVLAHVYGKGLPTYEFLDKSIRYVTTRLSIDSQVRFARNMARFCRYLKREPWKFRLYQKIFPHLNLLPTEHHMYDWWSAPIATHHTLGEVGGWFNEVNCNVVRSNPNVDDAASDRNRRHQHAAVTVLARRKR